MAIFGCTIIDRPASDGYTTRRFEFKPALLPSANRVEALRSEMPVLTGPVSYLLGYLVAGLIGELRSTSRHRWTIQVEGVKPELEPRDNSFALLALEVTYLLHEESSNQDLNITVVRSAAVWSGVMLPD